jgi:Putative cell-wall binding lipoprotein
MKYFKYGFIMLLALFMLTGCSDKAKEKAVAILNDQMKIEQQFDDALQKIVDLETKDQQTYQEILDQGKKNSKQAESAISTALAALEVRKAAMDQGRMVLQTSTQKLDSMEREINKMNNVTEQKQGQMLLDLYRTRSKVFDDLYSQYMTGLALDNELYQMLGDETLHLKQINNQIAKRNLTFDEVSKLMTEFNRVSELYQQEKLSFLSAAGIPNSESG